MKKYEILSKEDFNNFLDKIASYISQRKLEGKDFPKMNFVVKRWRKDKTPKQHRFYWVVIGQMEKAFKNVGYEFTREEIHEFVKKEHGYTKTVVLKNGTTVHTTKSISDNSEDVNIKKMMDLIDFAIRWTAINLDYVIEDPR